ncbi:MAG: sugar phosphate isomerase/epimerase [Desulfobacterales bacterium]|nr:sugar phosphate isomerase/epimerase [Desulfobacterales bacterium]
MVFRFKIGLKFYSTDVAFIPQALKLKGNVFNFIELYIIPGSYENTINAWKAIDIPYVIHAPHSSHGVNLAQEDKWKTNLKHFNETRLFADELGADNIIVHGGNNGSFSETLRQIKLLNEPRIALENKPKLGLLGEECVGWSPSEFRQALETGVISRTVLDFVHATCAARSLEIEGITLIKEFLAFNPRVFHLSDGDTQSQKDVHLNFGKGNLNLRGFLSFVPEGSLLTIEAPRDPSHGLNDFAEDVFFLRKVL